MSRMLRLLAFALAAVAAQIPAAGMELVGVVVDQAGAGVPGVIVIGPAGFSRRAQSRVNGVYKVTLNERLAKDSFVSFRHKNYKPRLLRISELRRNSQVKLDAADASVWRVPSCMENTKHGQQRIGDGLRVLPLGNFSRPISGPHDRHWYVLYGDDLNWEKIGSLFSRPSVWVWAALHPEILSGPLLRGKYWLSLDWGPHWHGGLPPEHLMETAKELQTRGWVAGDWVGLDVSGKSADGKYWRWVGLEVSDSLSYEGASAEAAAHFDRVIATLCIPR